MLAVELPFYAELTHEHESLFSQVLALERALALPPHERQDVFLATLRTLQERLKQHFQFEEQGGYMAHVLQQAPQLHRRVEELLAEHQHMTRDLEALVDWTTAKAKGGSVPADVGAPTRTWLLRVRAHEAAENQLVQEACNRDCAEED